MDKKNSLCNSSQHITFLVESLCNNFRISEVIGFIFQSRLYFYFATIGWMNQDRHMKKPNNVDCDVVYLLKNKLHSNEGQLGTNPNFSKDFFKRYFGDWNCIFLLLRDLFVHSDIWANFLYDFFGNNLGPFVHLKLHWKCISFFTFLGPFCPFWHMT